MADDQVFDLDPLLVQAAAAASPDLRTASELDYRELVRRLPRVDCDDFLARLADGDSRVPLQLRKRLSDLVPKADKPGPQEKRTIREIFALADSLEQQEHRRQEEEARRKHIAEMEYLAEREEQTWSEMLLNESFTGCSTRRFDLLPKCYKPAIGW